MPRAFAPSAALAMQASSGRGTDRLVGASRTRQTRRRLLVLQTNKTLDVVLFLPIQVVRLPRGARRPFSFGPQFLNDGGSGGAFFFSSFFSLAWRRFNNPATAARGPLATSLLPFGRLVPISVGEPLRRVLDAEVLMSDVNRRRRAARSSGASSASASPRVDGVQSKAVSSVKVQGLPPRIAAGTGPRATRKRRQRAHRAALSQSSPIFPASVRRGCNLSNASGSVPPRHRPPSRPANAKISGRCRGSSGPFCGGRLGAGLRGGGGG